MKSENFDLRSALLDNVKHSSEEVVLRLAEKRRSEKLIAHSQTLRRCCSSFMLPTDGNSQEPRSQSASESTRRALSDLMRWNRSLYQQAVFATKQRVLCERTLQRVQSAHQLMRESTLVVEDYHPLQSVPVSDSVDFATYLTATEGSDPFKFLDQFKNPSGDDRRVVQLVEFITKEFYQLCMWNKRIESIVGDIEYLNSLSTTSIDSTLVTMTDTIRRNIRCDRVSIWMIDHSSANEAWTRRLVDPCDPQSAYQELRIPSGIGLVGACFTARKVLNIPDAYLDNRFDTRTDLKTGYKTKQVVCVPVVKKDGRNETVISVIQAINKLDGEPFTRHEEIIINMFGSVASSVVNHCQLKNVQDLDAKRHEIVIESMQAFAECGNVSAYEAMRLLRKGLQRLFRIIEFSYTSLSSPAQATRIQINPKTFTLETSVSERQGSACMAAADSREPVRSKTSDLHPAIDIVAPAEDNAVVYSIPCFSNGTVTSILQFTTGDVSHFSITKDIKILNELLSCCLPFVKRAISI